MSAMQCSEDYFVRVFKARLILSEYMRTLVKADGIISNII
jgi:hypothetical protein